MTPSEQIGAFSAAFNTEALTPELRHACARSLLDTYAVGVAGKNEPASVRAMAYLATLGTGDDASLWGCPGRVSAESAAFYNGVAAHVLDYDDVTSPLRGHPSVVLWPALIALAEAEGVSMGRLHSAYVVGFEVMCKLAKAIAVEAYAKGWHVTASIGLIGAAAACSHLLNLDAEQTVNAIGIAVAQAAGTRANFGSDAKSFQAGHANAAAIRAARLAQAGFTSSPDAMDAQQGYAVLYGQGQDLTSALSTLGQAPLELVTSGLEVKKYPLCYATHRTLDGLLDLRAEHGLELAGVQRVEIETSPGALVPLIHHRPMTGLQGKFSLEYAVASALLDGQVGLATFTDESVQRPAIQAFLPCVQGHSTQGDSILPRWALVRVFTKDGQCIERKIDALRGSATLPLTDEELMAKAKDCYAWAGLQGDVHAQLKAASNPQAVAADFLGIVR
jgi:2-methylcitrate dehydratase PrpD